MPSIIDKGNQIMPVGIGTYYNRSLYLDSKNSSKASAQLDVTVEDLEDIFYFYLS